MILIYVDVKDSILLKSKDMSFHTLYHIISQCNSDGYIWYSDATNKKNIIEKLNISAITLAKHIASLSERKLLLPDGVRGRYRLNMEIFST
jgi:hypothetical protein